MNRVVLCGFLVIQVSVAIAQTGINESLLGSTEQQLQVRLPTLRKMAKPTKGAHGFRGLWSLSKSEIIGLNFETTFFFKNHILGRIEQRWASFNRRCATPYEDLVSSLTLKYGPGMTTDGAISEQDRNQSSVWMPGAYQVSTYQIYYTGHCELLLTFDKHLEKDSTEL